MSFLDNLGGVFTSGLSRAIDAEIAEHYGPVDQEVYYSAGQGRAAPTGSPTWNTQNTRTNQGTTVQSNSTSGRNVAIVAGVLITAFLAFKVLK